MSREIFDTLNILKNLFNVLFQSVDSIVLYTRQTFRILAQFALLFKLLYNLKEPGLVHTFNGGELTFKENYRLSGVQRLVKRVIKILSVQKLLGIFGLIRVPRHYTLRIKVKRKPLSISTKVKRT